MDFFSFLPIIIFIYAIATMFNPKNKAPKNRRQNPSPPQETWRERMEELERQWFPQEFDPKPQTRQRQPERTMNPSPEEQRREGYAKTEGFGTEGISGSEGSQDNEGVWGTEGTFGSEGTIGAEGYHEPERNFATEESPKSKDIPNLVGLPKPNPKEVQSREPKQQESLTRFPGITEDSLMQGVIWAEVLGKPRARGGWSYARRR